MVSQLVRIFVSWLQQTTEKTPVHRELADRDSRNAHGKQQQPPTELPLPALRESITRGPATQPHLYPLHPQPHYQAVHSPHPLPTLLPSHLPSALANPPPVLWALSPPSCSETSVPEYALFLPILSLPLSTFSFPSVFEHILVSSSFVKPTSPDPSSQPHLSPLLHKQTSPKCGLLSLPILPHVPFTPHIPTF